jgi:predicted PurR-regulated permease PerM
MNKINWPVIKDDLSNSASGGLQQAWSFEDRHRRWRKIYLISGVSLAIIVIGGLLLVSWPAISSGSSNWLIKAKNHVKKWPQDFQQWQNKSERAIIEGDILK